MRFPGIIPAITTPFDAAGAVDEAALERNVEALVEAGVQGVVATGTMGEAGSLDRDERATVIAAAARGAAGRVPVIAGVSAATAKQATAYATEAAAAGASALMALPPLGYRADAAELEAYFGEIGAAGGLELMIYNNPEASGVDMPVALIAGIAAAVEQVVAVKECSGDARRIAALCNDTEIEVLVGGDDWALEGLCAGATGWISGVSVVAPAECVALFEHCVAGELAAARELYGRMLPLARFDMTPKLVQYFKAGMDAVGFAGGPTRPPRLALDAGERAALADALARLGAPVTA